MRRAAVLGSPIRHSLSPILHTAAYAELGLADEWRYSAHECGESELADFIAGCDGSWAGLSLTMPLKRVALSLVDEFDEVSGAVGGANTIVFDDGRRTGYNTDVAGMVAALAEAGIERVHSATIIGAGATAASALAAVRRLGATGSKAVTVLARRLNRTEELTSAAERLGAEVGLAPLADVAEYLDVDLVVSTVPADAGGEVAPAVAAGRAAVFDVAYTPWPTPLARAVAPTGRPMANGFAMLVHQAGRQVELMTGRGPAPIEAMRAAGVAELGRRESG